MALRILAEAVLRLEHKLDLILKHLNASVMPMHFVGQTCSVCKKSIDYQVDMAAGVVTRKCDCKSGKLPPMYQLTPIPSGETTNGRPKTEQGTTSDSSSDVGRGTKGKDRG